MTGPDCAVVWNLIYIHLHLVTKLFVSPSFSPAGPDCVVLCNLTKTFKHQQDGTQEGERGTQDTVVYW